MSKTFTLGNSKEQIQNLLPDSVIKRVKVGERSIGLVRRGEKFFAFSGTCPHRGASLIEGSINGLDELICPLHQYRFELKTGKVSVGSCGDLEVFPCELTAEGLKISMPYSSNS